MINLYSRDLNVDIGNPILNEHFYPVPFDKYITIHTSNKVPAKNYSYWGEVISILKPELHKRNIKIVQVGTSEDPKITGVDRFINDTSMHQLFFLMKNSSCHVGIDSCPVHIASHYNIPTVSVYAHTYASSCDPVWGNKATILESHRNGEKPSFSYNEDPKRIDIIKPEEIAEAVFKHLEFEEYNLIETIFIGNKFLHKKVDLILNKMPEVGIPDNCEVRIRMDLAFNENNCYEFLKSYEGQVVIRTNNPLSELLINSTKSKIKKIEYISDELNEDFLNLCRRLGIDLYLACKSKGKLKEQRLKFFDFEINLDESEKNAKKLKRDISKKIKGEKVRAFSGKYYINGDDVFTFLGEPKKDLSFWIDMPYFYCYNELRRTN